MTEYQRAVAGLGLLLALTLCGCVPTPEQTDTPQDGDTVYEFVVTQKNWQQIPESRPQIDIGGADNEHVTFFGINSSTVLLYNKIQVGHRTRIIVTRDGVLRNAIDLDAAKPPDKK